MHDLELLADWVRSPVSEEEYYRLYKVANAVMNEVGNVVRTVVPAAAAPMALAGGAYMSGQSGLGEYRKTKAMFDPNVIRERTRMAGGSSNEF